MQTTAQPTALASAAKQLSDDEIIARVRHGEVGLFELIIRRYNQRLFRVAMGIVKHDSDAEDVMQEAYVRAFAKLDSFRGEAKFSTWLTKICVYEALGRVRRHRNAGDLSLVDDQEIAMADEVSPEHVVYNGELRQLLEDALGKLPSALRSAYLLRDVEGMSTAEAAECLEINEQALKMRLSRARALLRTEIEKAAGFVASDVFVFRAPRCDHMVLAVMGRIHR